MLRLYQKQQRPSCSVASNLAPLARRHDAYYDLLQMLKLSPEHMANLLGRGLSPDRVQENMYRTMPANWHERRDIACQLAKTHDLRGIPGFYTRHGEWHLSGKAGFLIPYLTTDGYVQGIQIRLDNSSDGKYRWLSSNPKHLDKQGRPIFENGTAAMSWVHVTGDTRKTTVCITEGALKGDVASFLRNEALFVCVPGVSSTEYLLDTLKELNSNKIFICYDMDLLNNLEVSKALHKIRQTVIENLSVPCETYMWNPAYKGIDDFLLYRRNLKIA